MNILDERTSTRIALERHQALARDYEKPQPRQASAHRRTRRQRLFAVLRPRAA
jgi:hypothetical protein